MRTLRTILVVVIILAGCRGAAERRVPSFVDVVEFTTDPIPPAPSDHFQDFKITRDNMKTILETYHVVTRERWQHDYHHVAGADRTGTLTLKDKTTIRWLVRPGGLARLTFPDQVQIYLAKEAQ